MSAQAQSVMDPSMMTKKIPLVEPKKKKKKLGANIAYLSPFESYTKQGRHFVKLYTIDDTVNRNDWGVTPEARAAAVDSFGKHPLLADPPSLSDETVTVSDPKLPHYGTHAVIGHPVGVENNGATYGIYEVTVDEAWDMIQNGQLSPVSPSIRIDEAHDENGKLIVDAYHWDHILFVDVPAFPNAGVVSTCDAADPESCYAGFGVALQAAFQGHDSPESRQDVGPSPLEGGTQGARDKTGGSTGGGIVKNTEDESLEAAELTSEQRGNLSDSDFAYIDSKGGRHLPIQDEAHVRAALGGHGWSATSFESDSAKEKAKSKICGAAKKFGVESELCGTKQGSSEGKTTMPTKEEEQQGCKKCTQLQAELDSLRQSHASDKIVSVPQFEKLQADFTALQGKHNELLAWQNNTIQGQLSVKAEAIADLEIASGRLEPAKRPERVEALKKFGTIALDEMQNQMAPLVQALQVKNPLKSKYSDPAQAASAEERIRQGLFGVTRTPDEVKALENRISGVR